MDKNIDWDKIIGYLRVQEHAIDRSRPVYIEIVTCLAQAVTAQQLTIIADKMPKRPMTSEQIRKHLQTIEHQIREGNPPPERPTGTNSAF